MQDRFFLCFGRILNIFTIIHNEFSFSFDKVYAYNIPPIKSRMHKGINSPVETKTFLYNSLGWDCTLLRYLIIWNTSRFIGYSIIFCNHYWEWFHISFDFRIRKNRIRNRHWDNICVPVFIWQFGDQQEKDQGYRPIKTKTAFNLKLRKVEYRTRLSYL